MTIATEALQRFCASSPLEARLWARRPYRRLDFIWATNGAMLMRITDDGRALDAPHEHEAPSMTRHKHWVIDGPAIAIPDLPAAAPCERCDGAGVEPPIDGFQGDPMQCMHCDGMGEEPSTAWCDGIEIGPGRFQSRLLRLLQALPGVVIVPGADHRSMAGIRFEGGIGGIMPLRMEA
jgi:hypothetical protein